MTFRTTTLGVGIAAAAGAILAGAAPWRGAAQDPAPDLLATEPLDGNAPLQPDGLAPETSAEAALGVTDAVAHDLSPLGMFFMADIVVQAVMVGLVLASILTWTVWLVKKVELIVARRRARRAAAVIGRARTLEEARNDLGFAKGPSWALVDLAARELERSRGLTDKEGVKERAAWGFQRLEANAALTIGRGMGLLATIGSTAPFVGLFGTVWGIMNSFIGIANAQTTNLAVVAPGIAEALLATGLGLAAAIPAVMMYNGFARSITGYRSLVADNAAEVLSLVSRDLDRAEQPAEAPHLQAAE